MDNINMVHDDAFIDQLSLYQSANNSNDVIKQNFIVRKEEFETIINSLKNKKAEDPLQHELILGRRGSGKSTLLKRIQIEIDENAELQKKYIAINLAEEQAGIYRLSDLWFEVLKELLFKFKKEMTLKAFSFFANNNDYTFYLYDLIHSLLLTEQKKAILLLDNLDRILENFNEDANALREILLNYNEIQIIGGSTRMDEHFWRYDKPFYEFFRRHRLEGLTFDEINLLLNNWSQAMHLPLLKDYATKNRGKIEALRILTDGLPRALQFFIQVLVNDSTLYGFAYLKKVMDKATPLYQERLNNLTPPQRKIVQEMAFIWEACSTKQLVEACRMEGKLISSFLKQLQNFGIIETINTKTKNHLYRISERFFNMWIIVTQGNPNQKRNAKYLTLFLETFYDSKELKSLALKHIENLNSGKFSGDKAMLLSKAYSQSKHISTKERDAILELTYKFPENDSSFFNELPELYKSLKAEIFSLIRKNELEKALELTNEIENESDGIKFFIQAFILRLNGNFIQSERKYLLSIEKENNEALNSLGLLYGKYGKFDLAEKYFLLAIEKGINYAYNNLATLYKYQRNYVHAEKYYLLAYENGYANALFNLTALYFDLNKNKKKAAELLNKDTMLKNLIVLKQKIIINIWNNIFTNAENDIESLFKIYGYVNLDAFLQDLLYLEQTQLVLSLFESEKHEEELQSRYAPLYYVVRILANKEQDNLLLKIPPEIQETVDQLIALIQEKQEFYRQPST